MTLTSKVLFYAVILTILSLGYGNPALAKGKGGGSTTPMGRNGAIRVLPGGILYPNFSRAGDVNASALSWDWGASEELMYSPPLNNSDSHGVSGSYSQSFKNHFAISAGYQASIFNDATLQSGFVGASTRTKRLSVGASIRKPVWETTASPIAFDLGSILKISTLFDTGLLVRGINKDPALVFAVGAGRFKKFSTEINFIAPLYPTAGTSTPNYRVVLASALQLGFVELGATTTYSSYSNEAYFTQPWRFSAGIGFWVFRSVALVAEYTNRPQTVTFGLVLYQEPPEKKSYVRFQQARTSK